MNSFKKRLEGVRGKEKEAPLGSGERFAKLKGALEKRPGVTNAGGLAAHIGRKKYGKGKFQKLAAAGRKA